MTFTDGDHYVPGIASAKRLGIQRSGWIIGDWFVSHSPRNGNSNAEGAWAHWVQLALSILQHPATAEQRPDVHAAVAGLENTDFYDEGPRFDEGDIARLFGEKP